MGVDFTLDHSNNNNKALLLSMLKFNFIVGSIFIFICSLLCKYMIMNTEQKKIKIEPRIKLYYDIYTEADESDRGRRKLQSFFF